MVSIILVPHLNLNLCLDLDGLDLIVLDLVRLDGFSRMSAGRWVPTLITSSTLPIIQKYPSLSRRAPSPVKYIPLIIEKYVASNLKWSAPTQEASG